MHYGAEYGLILQNRTGESSEHFLDQLGLAHSPVADRAPQEGLSNEFIGELDADLLVLAGELSVRAATRPGCCSCS